MAQIQSQIVVNDEAYSSSFPTSMLLRWKYSDGVLRQNSSYNGWIVYERTPIKGRSIRLLFKPVTYITFALASHVVVFGCQILAIDCLTPGFGVAIQALDWQFLASPAFSGSVSPFIAAHQAHRISFGNEQKNLPQQRCTKISGIILSVGGLLQGYWQVSNSQSSLSRHVRRTKTKC